jgi:putative oxidoreductase
MNTSSSHPLVQFLPAPLQNATHKGLNLWAQLVALLNHLQPAAALAARIYIAQVFILSGLTKIKDWDTTLALFADEYHVPLLSPAVAAAMGTGGELILPVLLVLGFAGRFAALGLFVLNIAAAISLSDIAPAALQQHVFWGSLLAGLAIFGVGKWSVDAWFAKHHA